jgi:hypothetical protein
MKNIILLSTVLFFMYFSSACTINVPWDMMDDYDGVHVVMLVSPDDADVLLNGKFIGAAYEFASPGAALRLASRQNELVLKKKGFREEIVDLRAYSSRHITLKIELQSETAPATAASLPGKAPVPESQPAYEAKSEPIPALPADKPVAPDETFLTRLKLTVIPDEASIYIDDRFLGLSPEKGSIENLRLKPGKHVIEIFKPGYGAYKKEITVPKQEKFDLAISLQKQ